MVILLDDGLCPLNIMGSVRTKNISESPTYKNTKEHDYTIHKDW